MCCILAKQSKFMNRRHFIQTSTAAAVGATAGLICPAGAAEPLPTPSPSRLPRWRGFNLLEKFNGDHNQAFLESDFEWIAELGFNFVRLPLSYHCWANPKDWLALKEPVLKEIDQAVAFGTKHHVHVNINFHRAPGYCVNPPAEALSLWNNEEALAACAFHWAQFAKRYAGIGNEQVSFDLLNEPSDLAEATYARVVRRLVEAIHEVDSKRLVIADGLAWGTKPVMSLASLGIGQSTRGYEPMHISHFRASWIRGSDQWPEPTWPLHTKDGGVVDRARLQTLRIQPWKALEERGVGIHVGEWGAFNRTPHKVALAWMKDCLSLWKAAGWGWALWNFRGGFGVMDSDRSDVSYENFRGHKLDREMLSLLQAES
jgi:endoglucanase